MTTVNTDLKKLFFFSFLILLVGQFDPLFYKINTLIFLSILFAIFLVILNPYYTKSLFIFIILLLILSHFRVHEVFGSLAGVISLTGILILILKRRPLREINISDKVINYNLAIIIIFNILGWIIKSQLPREHIVSGIISFFVLIGTFIIASKLIIQADRITFLIYVIAFLSIYGLITALINGLQIVPFKSILFGGYFYYMPESEKVNAIEPGINFVSMIDRPSGELGLIYFSFLFPLYFFYNYVRKFISINKNVLLLGLISSFLLCFIEFSKSHTIALFLSLLFMLMFYGYILKIPPRFIGIKRTVKVAFIIILIMVITQPVLRYDYIVYRFKQQPNLIENFIENPLTAEGTSRADSWGLAYRYILNNNFIIGHGYANGAKNRLAWFGSENIDYPKLDYHNLIYSLIPVFGWFGALSFLCIIFVTARRLFIIAHKEKYKFFYRVLSFAFLNLIIFLMVGELSISAMSSPHYMMLIFIILGLCNAVYYNRSNFIDPVKSIQ